MTRSDRRTGIVIAVAIIVLVSAYALVKRQPGSTAVITVDGVETVRIDLLDRTPRTFEVRGATGIAQVETSGSGSVRIVRAPCPDQICVHTKPAHAAGDTIVCVPNRLVITVLGPPGATDAVAQ